MRASDKSGRSSSVSKPIRAAGGEILRDLFQADDGGWLQDRRCSTGVSDKLKTERRRDRGRRLEVDRASPRASLTATIMGFVPVGYPVDLTDDRRAARGRCATNTTGSKPNIPKPTNCPTRSTSAWRDRAALDAFEQRPAIYDPADIARRRVRQRRSRRRACRSIVAMSGRRTNARSTPRAMIDGVGSRHADANGRQRAIITIGGQSAEPEEMTGRCHQAAARAACHRADCASHARAAQRGRRGTIRTSR